MNFNILKHNLKLLAASKHPISDSLSYFEGHTRYSLYYSQSKLLHRLMRKHIRQQIKLRIHNMNPICYKEGACIHCGCETPYLQMSTPPCQGLEYPPLIPSPSNWSKFLTGNYTIRATLNNKEYGWALNREGTLLSIFEKRADGKYYDLKDRIHYETHLE